MHPIVYAETDNQFFVDGTRRFIKGASFWEWVGAIILSLVFGVVAAFFVNEALLTRDILSNGIETNAHIVNQRVVSGRSPSYFVLYEYDVDGGIYQYEESVNRDHYSLLPLGTRVTVRYVASNPENARLSGAFQWGTSLEPSLLLLGGLILLIIGIPIYKQWQSFRFSRRGQLIDGTLIGSHGLYEPQGYSVRFKYTFVSPLGLTVKGKRTVKRRDLRRQSLPKSGRSVKVMYINDKSHRML